MGINDSFRLLENPEHAPIVVAVILALVFLLPELLTYRVIL
jgi:hypothetical protein